MLICLHVLDCYKEGVNEGNNAEKDRPMSKCDNCNGVISNNDHFCKTCGEAIVVGRADGLHSNDDDNIQSQMSPLTKAVIFYSIMGILIFLIMPVFFSITGIN